jgi:hypothetical protein
MKKRKQGSLPIGLRALAAYLGISPTLLSMTNTGRHGARQLGDAQTRKWEDLVQAHLEAQKTHDPGPSLKKMQKRSADDCARLAKVLTGNANHAAAHVSLLEFQLGEMARNQQQDREWVNTVDHLLAKLPNSKESANDRIWLQYQQELVLKRLQKNGLPTKVKLEAQIEMEKAKARIYRHALKKLVKKTTSHATD